MIIINFFSNLSHTIFLLQAHIFKPQCGQIFFNCESNAFASTSGVVVS